MIYCKALGRLTTRVTKLDITWNGDQSLVARHNRVNANGETGPRK
jgi:hypothetical protein